LALRFSSTGIRATAADEPKAVVVGDSSVHVVVDARSAVFAPGVSMSRSMSELLLFVESHFRNVSKLEAF
jgi:hypothetical protein